MDCRGDPWGLDRFGRTNFWCPDFTYLFCINFGHIQSWPKSGKLMLSKHPKLDTEPGFLFFLFGKSNEITTCRVLRSPHVKWQMFQNPNLFWLVVWNIFIFPIILGMSSSQLTFTPSFFRGLGLNHQAVLAFQPPDFRCESHRFVEPCVQRGSGASERREEPGGSFQRCHWTDGPKLVFELDEW